MESTGVARYRQRARQFLAGHWGTAMGIIIVPTLIMAVLIWVFTFVFEMFLGGLGIGIGTAIYNSDAGDPTTTAAVMIPIFALLLLAFLFVITMAAMLIQFGIRGAVYHWYQTNQAPDVMSGFSLAFNNLGGLFRLAFFQMLFIYLWSILLWIPGIVKSFSYSQAVFIYFDQLAAGKSSKEISALECITASRKLMDGRKGELFVLYLSFIGWAILTAFTFNIGMLWLLPYLIITTVVFYVEIAGQTTTSENQFVQSPADQPIQPTVVFYPDGTVKNK